MTRTIVRATATVAPKPARFIAGPDALFRIAADRPVPHRRAAVESHDARLSQIADAVTRLEERIRVLEAARLPESWWRRVVAWTRGG